jgi:hypothetical protein
MVRRARTGKVKEWTDRLRRFNASGQTVVEFCQTEHVSTPTFYQWRKKLASTSKTPGGSRRRPLKGANGFQELHVSSSQLGNSNVVTVRLPSGITIELGRDLAVIESVMAQLFEGDGQTANRKNLPRRDKSC